MEARKKHLIRAAVFLCIFLVLFYAMARFGSHHPENRVYQSIGGFYREPENTLHGVYIGSSNCYAFWNPLVAWHNYGLAIYPFSCGSLPFCATEYIMRDVRKTQPDAVFVVNVNSVEADDLSGAAIHRTVNYMPDSANKEALINYLSDLKGYSRIRRLEFRFPWVRTREYWFSLLRSGPLKLDGLKATSKYDRYLNKISDISAKYILTEQRSGVPDALAESTRKLLDYCDAEGIRVLFVSVPRAERNEHALGRINTVCDLIRGRGYEVLYLTDRTGEVGLDLTQDFYNKKHTNIHGSIKVTNFITEHLIERFGLRDRRGDAAYASWDRGWEKYAKKLAPCILDIELDAAGRDASLPVPAGLSAEKAAEGAAVTVCWEASEGAERYAVYRRDGSKGAWRRIAETEGTSWTDETGEPGRRYAYTVVPMRIAGGGARYGNFDYRGVGVRT